MIWANRTAKAVTAKWHFAATVSFNLFTVLNGWSLLLFIIIRLIIRSFCDWLLYRGISNGMFSVKLKTSLPDESSAVDQLPNAILRRVADLLLHFFHVFVIFPSISVPFILALRMPFSCPLLSSRGSQPLTPPPIGL
jgi:hypothetical protein